MKYLLPCYLGRAVPTAGRVCAAAGEGDGREGAAHARDAAPTRAPQLPAGRAGGGLLRPPPVQRLRRHPAHHAHAHHRGEPGSPHAAQVKQVRVLCV